MFCSEPLPPLVRLFSWGWNSICRGIFRNSLHVIGEVMVFRECSVCLLLWCMVNFGDRKGETVGPLWLPHLSYGLLCFPCIVKPHGTWVIIALGVLVILDYELMCSLHLPMGILWGLVWGTNLPERIHVSFCRFLNTSKLWCSQLVINKTPSSIYLNFKKERLWFWIFRYMHTHTHQTHSPFFHSRSQF